MVRHPQGATDPHLLARLQALIDERGWSWSEAARQIGVAVPTLSQWKSGKYDSPEKMNARVEKFLGDRAKAGSGLVSTAGLRMILEVCEACQEEQKFGVIIGRPGVGKTRAVRKYAVDHDGVVFVRADVTTNVRALMLAILGLPGNGGGTTSVLLGEARDHLRGKLLVIDEADQMSVRTLEAVRTGIFDYEETGLVLCGAPRLLQLLSRGPQAKDNLAQLHSRVDFCIQVGNPRNGDCDAYMDSCGVTDRAARKALSQVGEEQGFRAMAKLAAQAQRLANINKTAVDKDIVDAARQLIILRPAV